MNVWGVALVCNPAPRRGIEPAPPSPHARRPERSGGAAPRFLQRGRTGVGAPQGSARARGPWPPSGPLRPPPRTLPATPPGGFGGRDTARPWGSWPPPRNAPPGQGLGGSASGGGAPSERGQSGTIPPQRPPGLAPKTPALRGTQARMIPLLRGFGTARAPRSSEGSHHQGGVVTTGGRGEGAKMHASAPWPSTHTCVCARARARNQLKITQRLPGGSFPGPPIAPSTWSRDCRETVARLRETAPSTFAKTA